MCSSIQSARRELIQKERIATIGRLSTSIVHDLRNPLAAIYGGAEMLVDSDLPPSQVKRLAQNIYRASRRIQELLQDLVNVSRGKHEGGGSMPVAGRDRRGLGYAGPRGGGAIGDRVTAMCRRRSSCLWSARAWSAFSSTCSAIRWMPCRTAGTSRLWPGATNRWCWWKWVTRGRGSRLKFALRFSSHFTPSKRNGLGLGLALSRQTVLDHGGDMWADGDGCQSAARFCLRSGR